MKAKRTWILIADGARARIVARRGKASEFPTVDGMVFEQARHRSGEVMADRPGRSFESAGPMRHGFDPSSDIADVEEDAFAGTLIKVLEKQQRAKAFDALVLIAPASMLGHLRKRVGSTLKPSIEREIAKDLTHVPFDALDSHLVTLLDA